MKTNPYPVMGPGPIPPMFGRKSELEQAVQQLTKCSSQHLSVVGPRLSGKTFFLKALENYIKTKIPIYLEVISRDFRQQTPQTDREFLKDLARHIHQSLHAQGLEAAGYIDVDGDDILGDIGLAIDEIYAQEKRILIIFDGFDHVLASDGLTRNLWDNLVFLADKPGICFVTGSRGRLRELLKHNARPSIFWEKFNPTPIVIGKFAEKELEDLLLPFKGKGICFDSAAKKELMNETGGNSLLVMGLLNQLYEQVSDNSEINGEQIVKIGKEASELYRDILSELWEECPIDTRSDIADLTKHEIPLQDIPGDRRKYLETRGFALVSKNVIKASCRIFQRYVGGKTEGVSCMKRLFNSLDGFNQNIKSLLELRVAQLPGQNNELKGYIEKAIGDLQPKPSHTIIWVRSIVMQALDIIWQRELTPDKKIPTSWINEWKATEEERYWKPYYETSQLPQELGYQCALLEKITGTEYNKRVAKYISKSSYTLISFLNSVGNFGQHQNEAVSLGYAVAACFAAVELCENLSRELK